MKITNEAQLNSLKIGDEIKRYSLQGATEDTFYKGSRKGIETFIVKTMNPLTQMIGLIIQRDKDCVLSDTPVNIARLYKKQLDFITEGVWWL